MTGVVASSHLLLPKQEPDILYLFIKKRMAEGKEPWLAVKKRDTMIVLDKSPDEEEWKVFIRCEDEKCTIEQIPSMPKVFGRVGIVPRDVVYMYQPLTIRFSPHCRNMRIMFNYFGFNSMGKPQFLRCDNYDYSDLEDLRSIEDSVSDYGADYPGHDDPDFSDEDDNKCYDELVPEADLVPGFNMESYVSDDLEDALFDKGDEVVIVNDEVVVVDDEVVIAEPVFETDA